jgi:hypothetical protein
VRVKVGKKYLTFSSTPLVSVGRREANVSAALPVELGLDRLTRRPHQQNGLGEGRAGRTADLVRLHSHHGAIHHRLGREAVFQQPVVFVDAASVHACDTQNWPLVKSRETEQR